MDLLPEGQTDVGTGAGAVQGSGPPVRAVVGGLLHNGKPQAGQGLAV